ncbi:hypothetical protein DLJ53_18055 [Acuticoccus sediminis]|uniref:Uncharacterized protein n=1 Tax=Acuticoccus sediminis TaxID=2184697 RepID=A0A8B2NS44_9HYPH|nr:hypothetical protein [Acuticoccus sediminis]RAI01120.1 hypothetical protein DLJ53_18055 [Acuticoccus sediminis]
MTNLITFRATRPVELYGKFLSEGEQIQLTGEQAEYYAATGALEALFGDVIPYLSTSSARDAMPTTFDQDYSRVARSIYIGAAGDLNIRTLAGNDRIFYGLVAPMILPVAALRVNSEGTTMIAKYILGLA